MNLPRHVCRVGVLVVLGSPVMLACGHTRQNLVLQPKMTPPPPLPRIEPPTAAPVVVAPPPSPTPPTPPSPGLTDADRKATARAAYYEGISLQEGGHHAEALARFEAAQRLYDAPTHQVRIGQCHLALGHLVEASEVFEALARRTVPADAPAAFRDAQEAARAELARCKPRIPSLRIQTVPGSASLSGLVIKVNGKQMPLEILGIPRPVNPGRYQVSVWAIGYRETNEVIEIAQSASANLELRLAR